MHEDDEALRRRLYRPGASPADVDSYLDALGPAAPSEEVDAPVADPPDGPRSRGRLLLVAAAVLLTVSTIGGVLAGGATAPSAAPTPSATSMAVDTRSGTMEVAVPIVEDRGRQPEAAGVSSVAGPQRFIYTVAHGDTVSAIASRFDLCTGDVLVALPYGFDGSTLPAGNQLLLRRYTTTPPSYDASGAC